MKLFAAFCSLLLIAGPSWAAENVSIAGAANLVHTLDALNAEFSRASPEIKVTAASGASGSLVAQIQNGAPFDVFLSADLDYPNSLVANGLADGKSRVTFATGRLVVWTTRPGLELNPITRAVRSPAVKKIAVANLDTAPYGRAARQVLEKLGVWGEAQPKLVIGENISQTAQFVATGNADLGFVALSLVLAPNLPERGRWLEVPADLYAPLAHGAVLTTRGAGNPAARKYLKFLSSDAAKKILRDFGYGVPP